MELVLQLRGGSKDRELDVTWTINVSEKDVQEDMVIVADVYADMVKEYKKIKKNLK